VNERRRLLIALVAAALAPEALLAQSTPAPGKVWRVGFLSERGRPDSLDSDIFGAFAQGMRALGYDEGKNLVIEWRFAGGKYEGLPGLAVELVRSKVDVIVVAGTQGTRAAQKATTTIPIVMGSTPDPVGSGFVKSLSRPGGNITGFANLAGDLSTKQFEMLLSIVPKLSRLAVLLNPDNPSHALVLKSVQAAAQKAGVAVLPVNARTAPEIETGFSAMAKDRAGAVILAADQFYVQQRRQIAALATRHRMPSIITNVDYAPAGGLMSYGENAHDRYRRVATVVDKIFKGAKPGELPVEQPTKFELIINVRTAKALGLTVPQELLVRADKVIE